MKAVQAYANRWYDGNWLDIVTPVSLKQTFKPRLEGFSEEEWGQVAKLWSVPEPEVYLNNRDLDGFIKFFADGKCTMNCGIDCSYCDEVARKVVKVGDTKSYVALLDQIISVAMDFKSPLRVSEREEGEMPWGEDSNRLLETQIPNIPEVFRAEAEKSMRRKAKDYAKERGASIVEVEDVVRACLKIAPEPFLPTVIDSLKKEGIDVDRYE